MQTKDKVKLAVAVLVLIGAGVLIYFQLFAEPKPPSIEERSGQKNAPAAAPAPTAPKTGPSASAPPPPQVKGWERGLAPGAKK